MLSLSPFAVPFVRFSSENFHAVQSTFPPGTQAPPITKVLGKMWREMSREQQLPYVQAMEADIAKRLQDRSDLLASRPVCFGQRDCSRRLGRSM